ncbi:MAG: hypothetical protein QOG85_6 [Gaiellaceae bacterium]|nr:hypothetical protein [Gaiellaceae bacterium]
MEANEEEAAPATSRSEEISARAMATPRTARERVDRLVDSLQELIDAVNSDDEAPIGAKVACLRAMTGPLRLLATLTGEAGANEATIASSPFYRRIRAAVVDALRPYPDAARAVIASIERVERGGSSDLEAAAE